MLRIPEICQKTFSKINFPSFSSFEFFSLSASKIDSERHSNEGWQMKEVFFVLMGLIQFIWFLDFKLKKIAMILKDETLLNHQVNVRVLFLSDSVCWQLLSAVPK